MTFKISGIYNWLFYVLIAVLGIGCNAAKRLPESESLYIGSKLELSETKQEKPSAELKEELKTIVTYPVPNRKFLGIGRLGVWLNLNISSKLGQEPVLFSMNNTENTASFLTNRAQNYGWLDASTTFNVQTKKKKTKVFYHLNLGVRPYILKSLVLPDSVDLITGILKKDMTFSILEINKPYRLKDLRAERDILIKKLRNRGLYFLSPESLVFYADSNHLDKTIQLKLALKSNLSQEEKQPYTIEKVSIYPDFDPGEPNKDLTNNEYSDFLTFHYHRLPVTMSMLASTIAFKKNKIFREDDYVETITKLNNLKMFSSINIRFDKISDEKQILEAKIYLTPLARHNIQVGPSLLFSPQFYSGIGVSSDYSLRSIFKSSEVIRFRPTYSFLYLSENGKKQYGLSTLQTLKGILEFEKPIIRKTNKINAQQLLRLSTTYTSNIYDFIDTDLSFKWTEHQINVEGGFTQRKNAKTPWSSIINPLSVTYTQSNFRPKEIKDLLYSYLVVDSSLLTIVAPQIELTPNMAFIYDGQNLNAKSYTFFRNKIRFKLGGYILPDSIAELVGKTVVYQLTNDFDVRRYNKITNQLTLANRLLISVNLPLTFKSQDQFRINEVYSIGGGNSIRAFDPRTIGPGTIKNDQTGALEIFRHTGNMLLQYSQEWRYKITKTFETVLFADAGNIWNTFDKGDSEGVFRFNDFYKELAIGVGTGVRVNLFNLITIRFDVAFPIRDPSLPIAERWVTPFPDWGRINYNFAFGQAF